MQIYKLFRADEYAQLLADGETQGAAVDVADGFIHFSTGAQLEETARRHFGDATELWVLGIATEALGEALVWEPSRGGALFPHLFARLRSVDVGWVERVTRAEGEPWRLPLESLG